MNYDELYEKVLETSKELQDLGFYAKASSPADWGHAYDHGYTLYLIRGGTYLEEKGMVSIIHNSFIIELLSNEIYSLNLGVDKSSTAFDNLNDIIPYLVRVRELELYK